MQKEDRQNRFCDKPTRIHERLTKPTFAMHFSHMRHLFGFHDLSF